MAGLFGLDLFPNAQTQPSGGLFGGNDAGAPNKWLQALSLLGSTLQDVGSNGRTDHLASQQAIFQALADKAQKAAIAKQLGASFNTQPVQAPNASINTPAGPEALDMGSVTRAVNGQDNSGLPVLDGHVPTAKEMLPLYTQAVSAGVDPSPYMKLQEAASKQEPRILTPQEMQAYGFRPGSVGYMDENGVPKVLQTSDVKSQDALNQDIWLKKNDPHLPIDQQNANTNAARVKLEQDQAGSIDPATVHYWAQSVAGGAPMPVLGMGKQAAAYRQAILAEVAKMQTASGKSGADQNAVTGSYKANVSTLAKITPLRAATEAYENTMLQNMDAAKQMIAKGAGTTGVPVINRWQRYIKGEYKGDPDVAAFNTAIQTVKNEYAKIQSGSIGNTPVSDASRKEAEGMINPNMTPEQIIANFNYMTRETGNRARALRAQEGALRSGLSGQSDLPMVPGIHDPQAGVTPATAAGGKAARTGHYNPATGQIEWQ